MSIHKFRIYEISSYQTFHMSSIRQFVHAIVWHFWQFMVVDIKLCRLSSSNSSSLLARCTKFDAGDKPRFPHADVTQQTEQHSTAQHSTAQHSTAKHSTPQYNTSQRHTTAQHQHSTAQPSTAHHSTAHRIGTRQHSTSTAQHSTAENSTAQHSTAGE